MLFELLQDVKCLIFSLFPIEANIFNLSSGTGTLPTFGSIVVTPISPHTLTLRPIVFSDDHILTISFPKNSHGDMALAIDGQVDEYLNPAAKVEIQKSPFEINMINFKDSNYFSTLRSKLGWGVRGSN